MTCKCLSEMSEKFEERPELFKVKKDEKLERVHFIEEAILFGETDAYMTIALPLEGIVRKADGTTRKAKFHNYVCTYCPICGTVLNPDKESKN